MLSSVSLLRSGDSLNIAEVFDPIGNFWERCQPMKTSRSRVGVTVVNGLLYAIGGFDGQSRLSTVEVYNPETDTWARVSSMNSQRRSVETRLSQCARHCRRVQRVGLILVCCTLCRPSCGSWMAAIPCIDLHDFT